MKWMPARWPTGNKKPPNRVVFALAVVDRKDAALRWIGYDTIFGKGVIDDRPSREIARDIVTELRDCVRNARRNQGKIAATLSAGLDSRLLVGIARQEKIKMPLISIDSCLSVGELEIMNPILDYLQMKTRVYGHEANYFQRYARRYWRETGTHSSMHVWFAPAMQDRVHKKRLYMTGLGGSNLLVFGPYNERLMELHGEENLAEAVGIFADGYPKLNDLLTDDFAEHMNVLYRQSVERTLRPFIQSKRGVKDWTLQMRVFNDVSLITTMFRHEFFSFSPFFCNRALDLSLMVDPKIMGDAFYAEMFDFVDPELLRLPSSRDTQNVVYRTVDDAEIIAWMHENLQEGPLVANHYIDKDKLETFVKKARTKSGIQPPLLRTALALDFWQRDQ